ncbi:hypothetical protein HMPREF9021_02562 [Simonsiella muelleri ATCC 29453]|uniref:NinB protein n=2 Tax=Simonsiella TaxID=71 RepID=U6Q277_9NEIS|nr:hypothetical protein HMPREF9021_01787 [Simonsiella muelleri ATCC 29453]EJZ50205.1 hypothetical protein HMPREF9021_02562 [Simonsiella muelleri ATCC 29453]
MKGSLKMSDKFIRKFGKENRRAIMTTAWEVSGSLTDDGKRAMITIEPITRSHEQNAKLHAMLADIATQKLFNGKKLAVEQWKMLFVSGHSIATGGQAEMAIGLEGEVVNLRESTAKMSVSRCASLIEYIQAWGAMNDVRFRAKWD